ncbi:MAG TPA: hypothetical protein VF344_03480 [Candidatus Limnocylindrales bacterium]
MARGNEKASGTVRCVPEVRRIDNRALDGGAAMTVVGALFGAATALRKARVCPSPRLVFAETEVWGLR